MSRYRSLRIHLLSSIFLLALVLTGCGGGSKPAVESGGAAATEPEAEVTYDTSIPMVRYELDPTAGDPSVPAELGGPGFTGGEGWETNLEFPAVGDPRAIPGGRMVQYINDWPATLRMVGKDWNTYINYQIYRHCYEYLVGLHPVTLDPMPNLATHWSISEDKQTYKFRLDPRARWNDGTEVTAQDVVASFKLRIDPSLLDANSLTTFGKFNVPKVLSKYMLEVTTKEENWLNFAIFGGMTVFPAKEVSIKGSEYLDKYQFAFTANSGAYIITPDDIDMGNSITMRRRDDWWNRDNPAYVGMWNIGEVKMEVVKDPGLAFEKVKKGEIDYFEIPKAQWWAEVLPELDVIKRGLLVRRKFYNDAPVGTSGLAMNLRRSILKDVRVRKALQLLTDRKTMIEKLYFNEYVPMSSYWAYGGYANPDNEVFAYDEVGAVELLEEAGWTEVNDEGFRVKDGKELGLTVQYSSKLSERNLTIFQESCKRAGIRIELQLLTWASSWKNLREKEFDLMSQAWGAIVFPRPEHSWHSKLAKEENTNNVTSFADPEVDKLIEAYDREYDADKRRELIRQIDAKIYVQHPYVLQWRSPARRVVFWNKFGMPPWGVTRFRTTNAEYYEVWWVDPAKEKALKEALADPAKILDPGPTHNRFWQAWNKAQEGTP